METQSALLALCEGNHQSHVDSLRKASNAVLVFTLYLPKQVFEQTVQFLVV